MAEKRTLSAKKAGELLIKAGVFSKDTNYPDQAAKRLVKQGVLKGTPPRPEYPKEGYQIDVKSIEDYIELGKLKPSELVKLALELKRENAILKGEIEGEHQQTQIEEYIPEEKTKNTSPKKPRKISSGGRFLTTEWKVNDQLPCPLCNEWLSASNFKRHAETTHNLTTEEVFTQYKEQADQMVAEKKKQNS